MPPVVPPKPSRQSNYQYPEKNADDDEPDESIESTNDPEDDDDDADRMQVS
jgi:hypothetical protein